MNRSAYILLTLLALCGCEVITDTNGLPYQDLMVVKGVVQDGQPVDSINFTQTLPLNVAYTNVQAILPNVTGYITVNGQQYPLQYADSGFYNCPGLVGQAGQTYTLDAIWNGLHVHGQTTIPIPPVIDSIYVIPNSADSIEIDTFSSSYSYIGALFAQIKSTADAALLLQYDYRNTFYHLDTLTVDSTWSSGPEYGGTVYLDTSLNGTIWISSIFTEQWFNATRPILPFRADVYSYDPAYYNFLITNNLSQYNNGVFSSGTGLNPNWNITGDGFGIFIGVSEAQKVFIH